MTFRIGQPVVCVKPGSDPGNVDPGERGAVVGQRYTVRDVVDYGAGPTLYLDEIRNPPVKTGAQCVERGFEPDRFRLVTERTTDIGAFTALLNSVNHKPLVDA